MAWGSRNSKQKSRQLDVRFYHDHDALIVEAVKVARDAQEALLRQQKILVQLRTQLEGRQLRERQALANRHLEERQSLEKHQTTEEVHDLEVRQLQERADLETQQYVGGKTSKLEEDI